jgi:cytochrome c biogenesis protein CcmG/thiol:disulfide interchange protein DsbE
MNKLLQTTRYLIPLAVFIILVILLWRGLTLDPRQVPSALLNKPAPEFDLANLTAPPERFTNQALLGHVSLLNVWATWCVTCRAEHPFLMDLARTKSIVIYGLDYKDNKATAKQWLAKYGNPYQLIGADQLGKVAINWGVYGTPETFIIDGRGIIRYKIIGALTPVIWQEQVAPLIHKLNAN